MRVIKVLLTSLLLISCGASPAMPTAEPTRKPVDIIIDIPTVSPAPATDEPTFTPVPATFTLKPTDTTSPTKDARRHVSPTGLITGKGNETIILTASLPKSISVTADADAHLFIILASGERLPLEKLTELSKGSSVSAIEVITPYAWSIDFNPPTDTPTQTTIAVTRIVTKAPTRTKAPTSIPTVFLPSTDTPVPVVIQPTNPPQACCKVCTNSKACGNSCISSTKTCHQPPGCACQG